FANFSAFAQVPNQGLYDEAYEKLSDMLDGKRKLRFKEAVFTVENTYLQGMLDTTFVNNKIHFLKNISIQIQQNGTLDYQERDKETVRKYASLFVVMKDTTKIIDGNGELFLHPPFEYDFEDVFGHYEWEN